MVGTLGVIELPASGKNEAECQATRLNPVGRRIGDHTLLEWVARRVTDSLLLDEVAIVTDEQQTSVAQQLAPPDVSIFSSHRPDALGRLAAAARCYDADHLVRIPVTSPFIDPALIDRLICTANAQPGVDYIGFKSERGNLAALHHLGVFAEWYRVRAIYQADRRASDMSERENVVAYLRRHPNRFRLRWIPIPPRLDRDDVRLTVSSEDDWDHAQIIFEALGPDALEWQRIADLLDEHPGMREQMARLNRAQLASSEV